MVTRGKQWPQKWVLENGRQGCGSRGGRVQAAGGVQLKEVEGGKCTGPMHTETHLGYGGTESDIKAFI